MRVRKGSLTASQRLGSVGGEQAASQAVEPEGHLMILVVEGPSAAGKTTYCRQLDASQVVPERAPGTSPPNGASPDEVSRFWTNVNVLRWADAVRVARQTGLCVCDTDPLKLHYSWCIARAGLGPASDFHSMRRHTRRAIADGRLGLADQIACAIPTVQTLRTQRATDQTRTRRNFDRHLRLSGPLREWYQTLDIIDPGRVVWHWPSQPVILCSRERYDLAVFDSWMRKLPGPRGA
jgi:hypothetical protein